ncbi:chemotaxis protein CheA [Alicyclobacillus contaminans]|uniref:chemotaxis protein CheA n=1 Tax=Alicyclobacillus contaminans TaxID=392016 RepID=UPI000405F496|nr:chemotaxis protein CheA [Alicyclobacillus contaminans]GMA49018.1 chemotaxis protein CheA [Alicyclobacillus contaminans]
MDNLQYLEAFLDESQENTQILNSLLLKMEQTEPVDDDFAVMFRAAHTLKGMSATMGFQAMANLTHKLEDALGALRQHPEQLTQPVMDALFECVDALESDLAALRDTGSLPDGDHEALVKKLQQAMAGTTGEVAAAAAVAGPTVQAASVFDEAALSMAKQCQEMGLPVAVLTVTLEPSCQMKAARAILVQRAMDDFAQVLACSPPADVMQTGEFETFELLWLVAFEGDAEQCLGTVRGVSEVAGAELVWFQEWLERQPTAPTEKGTSGARSGTDTASSSSAQRPAKTSSPSPRSKVEKVERTIRVQVERLDGLMNLLSELVIDKTRLASIADELNHVDLKTLSDHISRIANDLQGTVLSLRMVPVETLFQRFPRMVRDLSKSLDKQIRLEMSGMETELDRTIIDEMGEALVHLIRNSADHGLESSADRLRQGKPAEGTIFLRAYSASQRVFIEVGDDGAGIDVEKVKRRAVEKGVIDAARAATLTRQQAYELLFASGFSTADKVSDISGRGVGLDAVRGKVESLGGSIEIDSERGKGSTFRIQLPLTLSISQALLVMVDGDAFAIPLDSVSEVREVNESDLSLVHGRKVLTYGESLVPLLDFGDLLFGRPSAGAYPWQAVICREGSKAIALIVDDLVGQQEIVHKSLGKYLESVRYFAGATILGNGGIALIVDVHSLMALLS